MVIPQTRSQQRIVTNNQVVRQQVPQVVTNQQVPQVVTNQQVPQVVTNQQVPQDVQPSGVEVKKFGWWLWWVVIIISLGLGFIIGFFVFGS